MSSTSRLLVRQSSRWGRNQWSLSSILELLSRDELTCEQLARYCHATAIAGDDIWQLGVFSRLSPWATIQRLAEASDRRRREGRRKSHLDGIPISVKANLAVEDQSLTAGSLILGETRPGPSVGYNAALVQRLVQDCGAIIIGITNMDEFGMGSLGTNTANGVPTKNPLSFLPGNDNTMDPVSLMDVLHQSPEEIADWHLQSFASSSSLTMHSAGGSSCGAAASVAHGSSLVALGSDTGGSIRLPASWCGVVGLKPSYGRFSRHGLVSYASSLDTVGFLTPTVTCAALVLDEWTRQQEEHPSLQDSTCQRFLTPLQKTIRSPTDVGQEGHHDDPPLRGIKIGIPAAFVVEECPPTVLEVWSRGAAILQQMGATVIPLESDIVSPTIIQQSLAAYYVLANAEASSNLARYDGFRYGVSETASAPQDRDLQGRFAAARTNGFGREVIRRILCGTAVLSSDKFHTHYQAAARLRALVTQQLHDALSTRVDYFLIPTVVSPPPPLPTGHDQGSSMDVDNTAMLANDIMTVPISLAGLCAVNIPLFLPTTASADRAVENAVGLQLVGHRLQEENLLRVAQWLQR